MAFYGLGQEFEMLDSAIDAAGMAWWIMELPSGAVFFNPSKITMLGYSEKDVPKFNHYERFTEIVHPDDYDECMKAMQDHLEGKSEMYVTRYRIKAVDGTYITYYDRGKIVGKNDKGEIAVAGVVVNITEHDPSKL